MPKLNRVGRGLLVAAASFANVGATAFLGFFLADVLSREAFGVTRVVSAYMVILCMFGTFTLNDALASHLAKTEDLQERNKLMVGASLLVAGISCGVSAMFALFVVCCASYEQSLSQSLLWVTLSVPFVCISLTYTSSLQSLEGHVYFAIITILSGLLPLLVVLPLSILLGLDGWSIGRVVSSLLMLLVAGFVVTRFVRGGFFPVVRQVGAVMRSLWYYGRIQILSGIFSLVLLSADVVVLEWLTSDLELVANYGLALLFTKAFIVVSSTLGKLYFKELAMVLPHSPSVSHVLRYLGVNQVLAVLSVGLLLVLGPTLIETLYGDKFQTAATLLLPMSCGLFFYFLWNALSVINISLARTKDAFLMSLSGAAVGVFLLLWLIPVSSVWGAVWAMNLAYVTGTTAGLILLFRSGYMQSVP